ncbi:hypothetical protein NC651_005113 [Populus alba x Populus x berolinensis]|nr:hypothetical protein NC651_005113 [Populus alba x Populus x berolinensis]
MNRIGVSQRRDLGRISIRKSLAWLVGFTSPSLGSKSSTNITLFFNLALMLSFILLASIVESRLVLGPASTPDCVSVHGAVSGDTCSAIPQQLNLSTDDYNAINPSLDCDKLFVSQRLCVEGPQVA